jgi:hypothetical protein
VRCATCLSEIIVISNEICQDELPEPGRDVSDRNTPVLSSPTSTSNPFSRVPLRRQISCREDGGFELSMRSSARQVAPVHFVRPGAQCYAAVIPGDGVAEQVITTGINQFLSLYNAALIGRLVLTWFPNPPQAIVGPLSTICDPYLNLFRGIIPLLEEPSTCRPSWLLLSWTCSRILPQRYLANFQKKIRRAGRCGGKSNLQ